MKPLVSILMITYNHEKYIVKAIESVLMQRTTFKYELVIGEDCSTDNTRKICTEYQKKYPDKIRLLLDSKNIGIRKNFDRTFSNCNGTYIAYLEGDDFWIDSTKLQQQVDFLEANADFSLCFHLEKSLDQATGKFLPDWSRNFKEISTLQDIASGNFIVANTVVFRNYPELLKKLEKCGSIIDWPLWVFLGDYGKIKCINKVMSVYRVHDGGVFSTKSKAEQYTMASDAAYAWKRVLGNRCNKEYVAIQLFYYFELIKNQLIFEKKISETLKILWKVILLSRYQLNAPLKFISKGRAFVKRKARANFHVILVTSKKWRSWCSPYSVGKKIFHILKAHIKSNNSSSLIKKNEILKKRIFFIAIGNSQHTCRWIRQIDKKQYDVFLYSSYEIPEYSNFDFKNEGIFVCDSTPQLIEMNKWWKLIKKNKNQNFSLYNFIIRFTEVFYINNQHQILSQQCDAGEWIDYLKPDLIHTLHTIRGGSYYFPFSNRDIPWCNSVWGSELFFISRLSSYYDNLVQILPKIDYLMLEGDRDKRRAQELGFKGEFTRTFPAFGGMDLRTSERVSRIKCSNRKRIIIKGYQNTVGRFLFGMKALERCENILKDYTIDIISAHTEVEKTIIEFFSSSSKLNIVHHLYDMDHSVILERFGQARVYLGLSISDGLPSSLIEAMACGAFPIQSKNIVTNNLIYSGENAILVDPEEVDEIEAAFRRALTDDDLVDSAQIMNRKIVQEKLNHIEVAKQVNDEYRRIFDNIEQN